MTATDYRHRFEYVPGKTAAREMTDWEIRRELPRAAGERLAELRAEIADRKVKRNDPRQEYPVEPL